MNNKTTDEHGSYTIEARWVEAWSGDNFCIPGWSVKELRRYVDGTMRISCGEAKYLKDHGNMRAIHEVFRIASAELGVKQYQ